MTDFVLQITDWYRQNARILPWRSTTNPYFIWLSEVILQQTRVDQGLNYYLRFTETFPTITDLANAEEDQVLKLWQGLGYYSRARNLHSTAKIIQENYHGEFPNNYSEIIALKGIGPYTAAAIASFAFNLPHAVVDGNVYRVLSRHFGIDTPIDSTEGKKIFQTLADELIPKDQPALFNQAIMEFGAIYCTPNNPPCENCIFLDTCASGRYGLATKRPVKASKTKVRNRYLHYFHLVSDDEIAVRKRGSNDVWEGLYEFPVIETEAPDLNPDQLPSWINDINEVTFSAKHILSHQRIHACFYRISTLKQERFSDQDLQWVDHDTFESLPIHRLMHKYWDQLS
jgi:A/G-specific adenine glycosylase